MLNVTSDRCLEVTRPTARWTLRPRSMQNPRSGQLRLPPSAQARISCAAAVKRSSGRMRTELRAHEPSHRAGSGSGSWFCGPRAQRRRALCPEGLKGLGAVRDAAKAQRRRPGSCEKTARSGSMARIWLDVVSHGASALIPRLHTCSRVSVPRPLTLAGSFRGIRCCLVFPLAHSPPLSCSPQE